MENIMLNLDEVYASDGSDFFQEEEEQTPQNKQNTEEPEQKQEEIENEITEDGFFSEEETGPEGVGDGGNKEKRNTTSEGAAPSSPTYSSIASAFKEDGVPLFSDAEEDEINNIADSESFREFLENRIQKEVESRLDEEQKRIHDVLKTGTNPSDIQVFESSISQLKSIKEEDITDESEQGENLRKNLIYNDYINRGYSKESALKKTQRSFDNDTDIEDAKEALASNLDFYETKYKEIVDKNREESTKNQEKIKQQAADLKKQILQDKDGFGGIDVSETIRRKVYETINKPVGKNEDGVNMTALQKYASEHPNDFMKYVGYYFVMTDGFKTLGNIEKSVEQKAAKKQMKAFEQAINTTARNADGSLKFVSGVPPEGAQNGWQLDI